MHVKDCPKKAVIPSSCAARKRNFVMSPVSSDIDVTKRDEAGRRDISYWFSALVWYTDLYSITLSRITHARYMSDSLCFVYFLSLVSILTISRVFSIFFLKLPSLTDRILIFEIIIFMKQSFSSRAINSKLYILPTIYVYIFIYIFIYLQIW